jgi:hypothetical protein
MSKLRIASQRAFAQNSFIFFKLLFSRQRAECSIALGIVNDQSHYNLSIAYRLLWVVAWVMLSQHYLIKQNKRAPF